LRMLFVQLGAAVAPGRRVAGAGQGWVFGEEKNLGKTRTTNRTTSLDIS
jgi:hypothetical protein